MLTFFNIFFTVLHLALIGFNLFAWIWPKTRRAHLVTAGATLASWFVLGIRYGWGYCPLTDWHWDVKRQLGETNLPNSFIKYFADKITGMDINPAVVDGWTLGLFLSVILLSVYLNISFRQNIKK